MAHQFTFPYSYKYQKQAVMNKNKLDLIYKSQAQHRIQLGEPRAKLYGSGTNIPNHRSPLKSTLEQQISKRQHKKQRAIDSHTNLARQSNPFYRESTLQRSKSGEPVKWQSPTKQTNGRQNFKDIIQQINEQNEKTFTQLDEDLKRIKNNLNRIEQESAQAHQSSQNQVLSEEIQLLQQQNERLRQKSQALINDKKKLSQQIDQYQSLIQREKIKQMTLTVNKKTQEQTKIEEFSISLRKLKVQLQQKQGQCEKLRSINSQLSNTKALSEKRQSLLGDQKNKLLLKIGEIQKERDLMQLKYSQEVKIELEKKDKHYIKLIKSQQNRYEELISKLKEDLQDHNILRQKQGFSQSKEENERLNSQITRLRDYQKQSKREKESLVKRISESQDQIEGLRNQIQVLSFSYKQTYEELNQKEEQIGQYKQNIIKYQSDIKKLASEIKGLKQKLQEQQKRSQLLQQLYSKLERQSEQQQYEAKNFSIRLNQAIRIKQHETQRYRVALESTKGQLQQMQSQINDLSKDSQKYHNQIRKKAQEIMFLKKQNLLLLSQAKSMKMRNEVSPPKRQLSPEPTLSRLQRLHSARQYKQQNEVIGYKEKQISKMRKIQKELNDLISDYKLQSQKCKVIWRQKENKYQSQISQQKGQINQLTNRIRELQKNLQTKSIEMTNKQQALKDGFRKKEEQWMQQQRKYTQIGLKLNLAQSQNNEMKKKIEELSLKQTQFNHNECSQKIQQAKDQSKRILDSVLNQIRNIANTNQYESYITRQGLGLRQIKSYDELQKMTQINFAFHNLRQKFKKMQTAIKEYSQSSKVIQSKQISIDKSSIEETHNSFHNKKNHFFQQRREVEKKLLQATQLQKRYQKQCGQVKEQAKEIDQLQQELRAKKRENVRLKSQLQCSEDEKEELKIKMKSLQQRLSKRQPRKKDQYQKQFEFITPTKQSSFYRPSYLEAERQAQQNRLRSRVRSFRSCDKRESQGQGWRDYQKRLAQYEINLGKANRQLANKQEKIQQLQKEKIQCIKREKKCESKYHNQMKQFEQLQQIYEKELKAKAQLESKVNELQHQLKILVYQIETINRSNLLTDKQRSGLQQQYQQTIGSKEYMIKKLRSQISQKDLQLASLIQQNEAKVIEMSTQHSRQVGELTRVLQGYKQKQGQLLEITQRKEEKILRSQLQISQLRQRIEREQKQKQSMLSTFSNNTSRLTKMLQEKEIEIQQLKFIQESTIINLQYGRNHRRRQNDNSFSFKQ